MIKIRPLNESDEGDIAQILNKTWNFDGENDELLESRMYFLECMTNASYARVA
ncbi:N-acetyltransferase, partial [Lactobacillus salivarius]|nr:N-acetyltransferase [Ligilactobacillus salivarius]